MKDKTRTQIVVDQETHGRLIRYKGKRQMETGELVTLGDAVRLLLDESERNESPKGMR